MMLRSNTGPVIQVDRLIFDPRYKIKPKPIPNQILTSTKNEEKTYQESHIIIPSDKLKILRLTMEDLINNKSSSPISQKNISSSNIKQIFSPVYESIDGRKDSIDLIKHKNQFERLC